MMTGATRTQPTTMDRVAQMSAPGANHEQGRLKLGRRPIPKIVCLLFNSTLPIPPMTTGP